MSASDPANPSIEELKARYVALKSKGQTAAPPKRNTAPPPISNAEIFHQETLPAGWYLTGKIKRGTTLRIVNTSATPGIAAQFWNAHDTSERFYAGDTIKVQWNAAISEGWLLLSEMGRALISITADEHGHNDAVGGISSAYTLSRSAETHVKQNTRDNFVAGAAKLGLSRRDVHPAIQFFAHVITDREGNLSWGGSPISPGVAIDLRAEMDVFYLISNTPHPLSGFAAAKGPIDTICFRSPKPDANDYCHTRTDEARRAIENTQAYLKSFLGGAS